MITPDTSTDVATGPHGSGRALAERIAAVVAGLDLGEPTARKSGRTPERPYVSIIKADRGLSQTQQIMGLAYATRAEAVQAAVDHLDRYRADLRRRLALPNNRALRVHYGLPRELAE
jgi:hypothetical protein